MSGFVSQLFTRYVLQLAKILYCTESTEDGIKSIFITVDFCNDCVQNYMGRTSEITFLNHNPFYLGRVSLNPKSRDYTEFP